MITPYFYHAGAAYLRGVYFIQRWEVPYFLMPLNKRWPGRTVRPSATVGYPL